MFHGIQYDYSSLEYNIYSKGKFLGKRLSETDALKLYNENRDGEPLLKEYREYCPLFYSKLGIKFTKLKKSQRSLNALKKELIKQRKKKEKSMKGKKKATLAMVEEEEGMIDSDEEVDNNMEEDEEEDYGSLFGDSSSEEDEGDPETKNIEAIDNSNEKEIEKEFLKKKKKKKKKIVVVKNKNFIPLQNIEGAEYF